MFQNEVTGISNTQFRAPLDYNHPVPVKSIGITGPPGGIGRRAGFRFWGDLIAHMYRSGRNPWPFLFYLYIH